MIPHVIYYKDLLFDDPDTEYLNRIYYKMEVKPRLKYLGELYKNSKKAIPNICVSDVQQIVLRRYMRINKIISNNPKKDKV